MLFAALIRQKSDPTVFMSDSEGLSGQSKKIHFYRLQLKDFTMFFITTPFIFLFMEKSN